MSVPYQLFFFFFFCTSHQKLYLSTHFFSNYSKLEKSINVIYFWQNFSLSCVLIYSQRKTSSYFWSFKKFIKTLEVDFHLLSALLTLPPRWIVNTNTVSARVQWQRPVTACVSAQLEKSSTTAWVGSLSRRAGALKRKEWPKGVMNEVT